MFNEQDGENVVYRHDNALLVTLKITADRVACTLAATTRSLADIIFKDTLDQLILESVKVTANETLLIGFISKIIPKGFVTLFISMGKSPCKVVHMVNFLVVDDPRAYNIILGRPFMTTIKVAVFRDHLAIKIPILKSVITVKGDQ